MFIIVITNTAVCNSQCWPEAGNSETPAEAYSLPCQTSKTKDFAKIVEGFWPLIIFAKSSILDA